ncbi:hypothetical protein FF52_03300 [Flavobacterium sp. F52]|nr:hypothetical protein FF52_03300 [Flavobacterium sp. F52]
MLLKIGKKIILVIKAIDAGYFFERLLGMLQKIFDFIDGPFLYPAVNGLISRIADMLGEIAFVQILQICIILGSVNPCRFPQSEITEIFFQILKENFNNVILFIESQRRKARNFLILELLEFDQKKGQQISDDLIFNG